MSNEIGVPATLGWWADGERLFAATVGAIDDASLDGPSLLPGWSRRTVIGHVARNADALVNLLTWARTGVETPMYTSTEARDAAIDETARLPADRLRADVAAASERLADAVRALPEAAWAAEVRTAQGRAVPAAEVPWMRCREVWVHAADLDAGAWFDDIPDDVLAALIDDVTYMWRRRNETPEGTFAGGSRTWGAGSPTVRGELPEVAAWLTGRRDATRLTADGPVPALPRWL
jgi:maleylpyruvate isomerase